MAADSFCHPRRKPYWLAPWVIWLAGLLAANGNPTGGTVAQGTALITPSGSTLNINQSSATAFITWSDFSIGSTETVNFNQPSSSSLTWNYVTGGSASSIDGIMNANGIVVLQNPNGISIGGSATVTAHGLIMTTASLPALNFSSGPWNFTAPPPAAKIVNVGTVNITGGGTAYLIASDIENDGVISAPGGTIGLYAGENVLVSPRPDGKGLSAQVTLPEGSVDNKGNLIADAGSIVAQAETVNQSGLIQANSAQNVNGTIELVAGDTLNVNASSTISAEGSSQSSGGGVTLQAGNAINNNGSVVADGSSIEATAATINQSGILQANTLGTVNGIIQLETGVALNLGAGSQINANGDSTFNGTSPGGFIVLNSSGTYSDVASSTISLVGNSTGQGGILEFFAPGLKANKLNSTVAGYFLRLVNPQNMTLSDNSTTPGTNPNLNVNDLDAYSQIDLWAQGNIEVSTLWTLPNPSVPSVLNLNAGNSIIVDNICGIGTSFGGSDYDWNLNLTAGTQLPSGTSLISNSPNTGNFDPDDPSGPSDPNFSLNPNYGIYLEGSGSLFTQSGNINLWAANEVFVTGATSFINNQNGPPTVIAGQLTTFKGGSISVTTEYGNVFTGDNVNGYDFDGGSGYSVDPNLGGISTTAGGNVTITAGGDVISYLPVESNWNGALEDPGTGAFGPEPGNVTITAGGNVYGHYVVANGVGTITAGGDVGVPLTNPFQTKSCALSLINGSWSVYAPQGNIYLQDINNPDGIFNGSHSFDYSASDSILLDASGNIEITGDEAGAPQSPPSVASSANPVIPIIIPGSLTVMAGGNFTLDSSVILFPSPDQYLNLNIGGSLLGGPNGPINLEMSDSSATSWSDLTGTAFGPNDHAATPPEINNPNPVEITVGGSIENLNLYVDEEAQLNVGQNIDNSSFIGENLHSSDVTAINVGGSIEYSPLYSFIQLSSGIDSAETLDPTAWDSVFDYAINPADVSAIESIDYDSTVVKNAISNAGGLAGYLTQLGYLLFPSSSENVFSGNPGFVYDSSSQQLGFKGIMSLGLANLLESGTSPSSSGQPQFAVLEVNAQGAPVLSANGDLETTVYTMNVNNWASAIGSLYKESQNDVNPTSLELGLQIGGPGQLNITAQSIDLGNANGIISAGFGSYGAGSPNYANLEGVSGTVDSGGAAVNVTVTDGDLDMINSCICSIDGGNVNVNAVSGNIDLSPGAFVFPTDTCYGIWTSGHSDVNVTASGDIDVGSSRIGTFNGGNVFIESYYGNVSCGFGADIALDVPGIILDNGIATGGEFGDLNDILEFPTPYGSGILAEYPLKADQTPGASGPGNITVETPEGSISSELGGISQFALDATIGGGPQVLLEAGTPNPVGDWASKQPPLYDGNIDLGNGIVLGGTVTLLATGDIQAAVISKGNAYETGISVSGIVLSGGTANVTGNFSGTAVGIGGISVSGDTSGATLLSQNVSANGGPSQSTLGTSGTTTAASQSAANQNSQLAANQATVTDNGNTEDKNKKKATVKVGRVTVMLSSAVPGH